MAVSAEGLPITSAFLASDLNRQKQRTERLIRLLFLMMTVLLILPVAAILGTLVYMGAPVISMDFLFTYPTDGMTAGGILPALIGTIWLVAVALMFSVPLGVAAADLAIYLAGADPFAGDRLGRLAMSRRGLARRDRLVLTACRRAGLAVAVVMAGGYAPAVEDVVVIHLATVRIAAEMAAAGG